MVDFGFKPGIDIGGNIPQNTQPQQIQSPLASRSADIPVEPMQSYSVNSNIMPGVSDDKAQKIMEYVDANAKTPLEKKVMLQDAHETAVKMEQKSAFQKDRSQMKAELMDRANKTKDPQEKGGLNTSVKLASFADIIRDVAMDQGVDLGIDNDQELITKHLEANPSQMEAFKSYVEGRTSGTDVLTSFGIGQPVEEIEEDKAQSVGDFFSGEPISTKEEIAKLADPLHGGATPVDAIKLVGKSVLNLIPNTIEFGKGIGNIIFNPKQTVEGLTDIGKGIIDKAQGNDTPQAEAITGMWDSIKETVTDPVKFGTWVTENPLDILAVASPKTIVAGGEAAFKGVSKGIVKVGKGTTRASEFIAAQGFGINQGTIRTIVKDPKLFTKVEKGIVSSEETLGTLGGKIDDAITQISETGKGFQKIKETAKIDTPLDEVNAALTKRGIKVKDGKLDFTDTNMADTSDLNAIQKAYDMVNTKEINVINTRGKLDDLINFESRTTSKGQGVVKEIRRTIDNKAKKEVKGLAELDASFSEQTKLLKSIKKDFLNPDGTFKDNAMSRLSNLTKKGNEAKLKRVQELVPGIEENINAIRAFEDVTLAGGQKVGSYLRGAGTAGIGAMAGGPVGAVIGLLITSPQVATSLLKGIGYSKQFINGLTKSMRLGIKLTPNQIKVLEQGLQGVTVGGVIEKNLPDNQ